MNNADNTAQGTGDTIGRDQVTHGDTVHGDKVAGDKVAGDKNVFNVNNIIQQAQSYTPSARHQLRTVTHTFTGRADELDALLTQLRASGRVGISGVGGVEGMGGIGKSELANLAAHALAPDFPDAQLYVELGAHSAAPLSTAQALAHCVRPFITDPNAKLPDDERALADLYRDALTGKRAIVLLDDARDDAQVHALLPPAGCLAIVTTRRRLESVPQIALPTLPRADAIKLLVAIAPRLAAPTLPRDDKRIAGEGARLPAPVGNAPTGAGSEKMVLNDLAAACGDLPIALTVAGGLLNARRSVRVQAYLGDLRARGLDALSSTSRQTSVDGVFDYSYRALNADQQAAWRALAIMPSDFDRDAALAVIDPQGLAESVDDLVMLNLLTYDTSRERFGWHDLLQQFARKRLSYAERDGAQRRHALHFLDVLETANQLYLQGGDDMLRGLALFDAERAHIFAGQAWAAAHRERDDRAAEACSNYAWQWSVLNLRLHARQYITWLDAALAAARRLDHKQAVGAHLGNLGNAYFSLGEPRRAITFHEQQLTIVREIGDRRGEGNALGNLGLAYADLGEPRKAIEYHEQALVISREIGDRRAEGQDLGNLGLAYADLGEPREAIEYHEQALVIAREIGDRQGEGSDLGNLGIAYADLGEPHKAIEYYEQHRDIARDIGDRQGEGSALGNLGIAYFSLGEPRKAIAFYEQHRDIAREIGDRRGEGIAIHNFGEANAALGHHQIAVKFYNKALEIFVAMDAKRNEAESHFDMSQSLHELGANGEALSHAEAALKIYEAIEDPNAEMVRQALAEWRGG